MKSSVVLHGLAIVGVIGGVLTANAATYYVRAGASGGGTSWADAMGNLQGGIEACASAGGGEVWVAAGIYVPDITPNGGAGSRQVHFSLRNGVTVYGGFPASGTPGMGDRDPEAYPTVCSGMIGDPGYADDVYHIFYHPDTAALDETAVLDGVILRNGNADTAPHHQGGGMYNDECSPTLRNCVFDGCRAVDGGGLYNSYGTPALSDCLFTNNVASTNGGGMANYHADATILDCVFVTNAATTFGGGLFNLYSDPLISNCVFRANTTTDGSWHGRGSAMGNRVASAQVLDCLFEQNNLGEYGCVYEDQDSSSSFLTCTFRENRSWWGGAVYCYGANDSSFVKCLFEDNFSADSGGAVEISGGRATFSDCVMADNEAGSVGGGVTARSAAGLFVNTLIVDNVSAGDGGGAALSASDCLFINCTITRNTGDSGGGAAFWGPGDDQFINCIVRYNDGSPSAYENLRFNHSGDRDFSYCNVWYDDEAYPGTGNTAGEVYFTDYDDPDGADNEWMTADDGMRISSASACRDAGDTDSLPSDRFDRDTDGITDEQLPLDILGRVRVHNDVVDMGAYEFGASSQAVYSIDFNLGTEGIRVGGGALHQDVTVDHAAEAPLVAGQSGWSFTGWDADFSHVTTDLTVNALYSLNTHTVYFDLGSHAVRVGGGELVQNVPHGSAAVAPRIVMDTDWYFRGWSAAFDNVTSNLFIYATVQQIVSAGDILCVKVGGTGNGMNWANAMGDLQAAIGYLGSQGTGQVWVAAGTYYPNSWPRGGSSEREMHFSLYRNVRVYGGFPATGTPGLGDRDWLTYPTTCSGDLGDAYVYTDNVYHVFYHPAGSELSSSSVLDGFVIEWGSADDLSAPNNAGGGMYTEAGNPTLIRCAFGENRARYGGGAYCKLGPSPSFTDCRFSDNIALVMGGGMRNYAAARPSMTNCVFHSNEADYGGGMANDLSSPKMKGCVFEQNEAFDWAGGIWNAGGIPDLANCLFDRNVAPDGAGVYNSSYTMPWLANVVFVGNDADYSGGAMYNESYAKPDVWQCTIVSNTAGTGGGIYNWSAAPDLRNSILWDNSGGELVNFSSSTSTVFDCIVEGGFAGGTHVLNENPAFANFGDFNGADNEWFTGDDGLQLTTASPAINSGDTNSLPLDYLDLDDDGDRAELLPLDFSGNPRIVGSFVDMGAYEYPTAVTHTVTFDLGTNGTRNGGGALVQEIDHHGSATEPIVAADIGWSHTGWDAAFDDITNSVTVHAQYSFLLSAGDICYVRKGESGNGTSWDEATGDLQGAIEVMASLGSGQVWVAEAAYLPDSHPNGGSGDRQMHFSLRNNVTVLGGFEAEGNPGLGDRDPEAFPTVLSGNIGLAGDSTDNVYHIFYHPAAAALGTNAVLDGFTITDGNADGAAPHNSGGGVYNSSCSPVLRSCVLSNNAASYGGGMYNLTSSPRLTRCIFTGNDAVAGGGMRNYTTANPNLADCSFEDNSASTDGGAMYNHASSPTLANCRFLGNSAVQEGGAIYDSASSPLIQLSTFNGNSAGTFGGGIYSISSSGGTLGNCILWGNTAPGGSNLYDSADSSLWAGYCTVGGGWTNGNDILDSDPLFADANLRLSLESPAIDAGSNGSLPPDTHDLDGDGNTVETIPLDYAEETRVTGGTVDQGAYEYTATVHIVTFDPGAHGTWTGGGELVQHVIEHTDAVEPTLDLDLGWMLTGWSAAFTDVTNDVATTAQYEYATFDVDFDLDPRGTRVGGGELAQVVPYGDTAEAPLLTVADGWYFRAWDRSFGYVTQDLNVAAVYQEILPTAGICHVREDGTDNGSSWSKAMGDLQAAIQAVHAYGTGEVWVAAGTYLPNSWPNGGTGVLRQMHFSLANHVDVYGGFPATGDPGMGDRDPALYPSVCSGDIGKGSVATDNVYHVFYHSWGLDLDASAVLDGFKIGDGYASGAFPEDSGGGMLNRACSPVLRQCVIDGNFASWGGGMNNMNSSSPQMDDCLVVQNQATWGGGMYSVGDSHPVVTNSTFCSNMASRGAGLYSSMAASQDISGSLFEDNVATENGGGLYLDGACGNVSRSRLLGNQAVDGGGAVLAGDSRLFCSLVVSNQSSMSGGGIYLQITGRVESCTITENAAGKYGGGIWMAGPGRVLASIIQSNTAVTAGPNVYDQSAIGTYDYCCSTPEIAGTGLVTNPPSFVNPAAGNFRLAADSPCIDSGPAGAEVTTDLDGGPRPLDGDADGTNTLDIGAYEYLNEFGDSDGDLMIDGYENEYGFDLLDPSDAGENSDQDSYLNWQEAVADTDPFDTDSYLRINLILMLPEPTLYYWPASTRRVYTVIAATNLPSGDWLDDPTANRITPPASGVQSIHLYGWDTEAIREWYGIRAEYP